METTEKTELSILSEISRISGSPAGLSEKLSRITCAVARGMGKDGASLFLLDDAGATVTLAAAVGLNQETIGRLSFPVGLGIAGWVAEQKVPLALEDPFNDVRFSFVPESGIERFRSLAAAPILDDDRCIGVLFVLSVAPWRAAPSDMALLTTTASQLAGVIRSTRLLHDVQQRLSELASIHEIGQALTSTLDTAELLTLIARTTAVALDAEGCAIRLQNTPAGTPLATAGSHGLEHGPAHDLDALIGHAAAEHVTAQRRPIAIIDASVEPAFAGIDGIPAGSVLSAPLL